MSTVTEGVLRSAVELVVRTGRRIVRAFRSDHTSLATARMRGDTAYSGGFYLVACFAPSRRRGPAQHARLLATGRGIWTELTNGGASDRPEYSSSELIRFARLDGEGHVEAALEINAIGATSCLLRLAPPPVDGDAELSLEAVTQRLHTVVDIAQGRQYRALIRRRRLDWRINVTPYVSSVEGTIPWRSLRFPPGLPAPPRANAAQPFAPVGGLAMNGLRGRRVRRASSDLVLDVVRALLVECGYLDVEQHKEALRVMIRNAEQC